MACVSDPKTYPSQFDYVLQQTHQPPLIRAFKATKRQRLDRTQSSPLPIPLVLSVQGTVLNCHDSISTRTLDRGAYLTRDSQHTSTFHQASKPHHPPQKRDLNPCHICHRRPTLLSELDQYANCEGCGDRTCWICIRECAGYNLSPHTVSGPGKGFWGAVKDKGEDIMVDAYELYDPEREGDENGEQEHRRMVCSRCCVEKGCEGEVWCLGCVRSEGSGMD